MSFIAPAEIRTNIDGALFYRTPINLYEHLTAPAHEVAIAEEVLDQRAETIRKLGGIVVNTEDPEAPIPYDGSAFNPPANWREANILAEDRLRARYGPKVFLDSFAIAHSNHAELYEQLDAHEPFVLSHRKIDRGFGKYLVETPDQLDNFYGYLARHPDLADAFAARPYVESASDYYTSLRVDVTASGTILGASLMVSTHTKDATRQLVGDTHTKDDIGIVPAWLQAFEDPSSPYFLNSRNIRSSAPDSLFIPLCGRTEPPSAQEATLLRQHGFDPEAPKLPTEIVQITEEIGVEEGPGLDLIVGVDWIIAKDGRFVCIELNTDPGTTTYNACWAPRHAYRSLTHAELREAYYNTALYYMAFPDPCDVHFSVFRQNERLHGAVPVILPMHQRLEHIDLKTLRLHLI